MAYTNENKELARVAPEKDFYARQAERIARRSMVAERDARRQALIGQVCFGALGAACLYLLMFYAAL